MAFDDSAHRFNTFDDFSTQNGHPDNTFYEILGVGRHATQEEIQRAYQNRAMELNPARKSPDAREKYDELYQQLLQAYEVLRDPTQRKLYDKFGREVVQEAYRVIPETEESNLLDAFESTSRSRSSALRRGWESRLTSPAFKRNPLLDWQKQVKQEHIKQILKDHRDGKCGCGRHNEVEAIEIPINVTLADLYSGANKEIEYTRSGRCPKCRGKGGSKAFQCRQCDGVGMELFEEFGSQGRFHTKQCTRCHGYGSIIEDCYKCHDCQGTGLVDVKTKAEVKIPIGSEHGEKITLAKYGHATRRGVKGDVVCIVFCDEHKLFQRMGADLLMTHNLSLKEALCGYDVTIPHLSGNYIRIRSGCNHASVQPNSLKVLYGFGMVQKGSRHSCGHLYIRFNVKLPTFSAETLTQLVKFLADEEEEDVKDSGEEEEEMERQITVETTDEKDPVTEGDKIVAELQNGEKGKEERKTDESLEDTKNDEEEAMKAMTFEEYPEDIDEMLPPTPAAFTAENGPQISQQQMQLLSLISALSTYVS